MRTDHDPVTSMLKTRFEDIFKLSEDGLTFVEPVELLGVPRSKILESDCDSSY